MSGSHTSPMGQSAISQMLVTSSLRDALLSCVPAALTCRSLKNERYSFIFFLWIIPARISAMAERKLISVSERTWPGAR